MQQSIGENIIVENSIWFFKCQSKCWKNKKTDQLWQVQWRCYEICTRYFKINISRNARKCYDERKTCRPILSDMQNLEFHLLLPPPHFTNPNSFPLCFPIKIKKKSDSNAHIVDDLITVNSFFTYKIKEIQIMRYGDGIQILPINSPYKTYQYSDSMLNTCWKNLQKQLTNY